MSILHAVLIHCPLKSSTGGLHPQAYSVDIFSAWCLTKVSTDLAEVIIVIYTIKTRSEFRNVSVTVSEACR